MPKQKKKQSKKNKEVASFKNDEKRTVAVEKVVNGFIVNQTISTRDSYQEKKVIAKTKKEANSIAAKLL